MDHKSGCLVCGAELVYATQDKDLTCFYCGAAGRTSVACAGGHYVCDTCHSGSANDLIERFCSAADSVLPVSMAITLMKDRRLKMHGPEHHFLVPAVLLAAYCNATDRPRDEKAGLIKKARSRAEEVKGGSCGFNGTCGAAVGTGIFVSLATGATPLSRAEWRLAKSHDLRKPSSNCRARGPALLQERRVPRAAGGSGIPEQRAACGTPRGRACDLRVQRAEP